MALSPIRKDVLMRTAAFSLIKKIQKASYAIEGESPPQKQNAALGGSHRPGRAK